jgi:uncharacterized protein
VTSDGGRVRFTVHVQPRASNNQIAGVHGDALKVRLTAPPVEGAANAELVAFLSSVFVVKRQSVRILAGESSRSKIVEIDGITERAVHDVASGATRRC